MINQKMTELATTPMGAMVGRCTLIPPDPQLKGAWYPGGFNPRTYRVKNRFQNVPFKRNLHHYAAVKMAGISAASLKPFLKPFIKVGLYTLTPPDP
jgi:hypothetical protein